MARKLVLDHVAWVGTTDRPVFPGGVTVEFERRRYGTGASSRFFTWGTLVAPGYERLSLGDPWPKINPGRLEVEAAAWHALIGRSMERMAGSPRPA